MYHLAKVVEVFSKNEKTIASDSSVQVQLEMWDDNLIIFGVHPELNPHIQKGQYVLVEYGFHAPNVPVNTIIKILDPKVGEASWKRMKSFYDKRKRQMSGTPDQMEMESIGERGMVR